MSEKNIGQAFTDSLASNLSEVTADLMEAPANALVQSEVLQDIPVFGSLLRLYRAASSFRDYFLCRKLIFYLREVEKTTLDERIRFLASFESDEEKRRFGEFALHVLDQVSSVEKAQILGKLANACIKGAISLGECMILSEATERLHLPDLDVLRNFVENEIPVFSNSFSDEAEDWYKNYGMAQERLGNINLLTSWSPMRLGGSHVEYIVNEFAKKYIEIVDSY